MSVRPATPADAAAVAALAAEDETRLLGRPSRLSANDVAMWWSRTDLGDNSWLIEEHGELVAAGWAEKWGEEIGTFVGIVAQGWKDRGIGAQLAERGEAAARRLGAVRAHAFTLAADARAAALFGLRGYREARRFYDMAIELDGTPPQPRVPEGLRLETFRPDEAYAFWQALDEAFQDHWEHHSTPFEEWWEQKQATPDHDPTLWFVVRDGDEVAAVIRNDPDRNGGGYVGALGVRRAWRGRGLGRALLHRTFGEFHSRGVRRVTLGVDAESPTGATELYASVGMEVEMEAVVFQKALA